MCLVQALCPLSVDNTIGQPGPLQFGAQFGVSMPLHVRAATRQVEPGEQDQVEMTRGQFGGQRVVTDLEVRQVKAEFLCQAGLATAGDAENGNAHAHNKTGLTCRCARRFRWA